MTQTPPITESLTRLHSAAQAHALLPWLAEARAQAWQQFSALPWPTRKTEAWKYTSLAELGNTTHWQPSRTTDTPSAELMSRADIPGLDADTLVLLDGQLITDPVNLLTQSESQRLEVVRFSTADNTQAGLIQQYLGSTYKSGKHLFAELNTGLLEDGLLIRVPKNCSIRRPLRLLHLYSTCPATPETTNLVTTRLLLIAEPGSDITLIEQHDSLDQSCAHLVNHLTEIVVKDNAQVTHTRLQLEHESLQSVHGTHVHLQRDSRYRQHQISFASQLKRNDLQVAFLAPGADAQLNGVFLGKHQQHIDNQTALDHIAPQGSSQETYKGLVTDKAKAIFNGRIHIHPDAQKTEAHLSNKNLLLSKEAEVDTKPELEIYADDVKCSHGATIGQLDDTSLFYFQSRGISREAAEAMLCFGFINEMVEQVPLPAVRDFLTARLSEYLHDIDQLKALTL